MDEVKSRLESFGLASQDPTRLRDGAVVLGLKVWGKHNTLRWKQWNSIPELSVTLTLRTVFSICKKLVGHFPVIGWLRAATGMIKRRASMVTYGWHDTVKDALLKYMMVELLTRVRQDDPVRGRLVRDWGRNKLMG